MRDEMKECIDDGRMTEAVRSTLARFVMRVAAEDGGGRPPSGDRAQAARYEAMVECARMLLSD